MRATKSMGQTEDGKIKQAETVAQRRSDEQERLLEVLRKMPIIQVACEKASIGRTTVYDWRHQDETFRKAMDQALAEGDLFVNDMSESQLISLIKDKHFAAIMAWLKHHHPKYATRIEVVQRNLDDDPLTPEQQAIVDQALRLASIDGIYGEKESKNDQ